MKNSKKIIALFGAIITLFSMLGGGSAVAATEDNASSECASTAEYILSNLDSFASEYNRSIDTKGGDAEKITFKATSCEFKVPVYIEEYDKYGIYLDFDGENGYMIVTGENEAIAFETKGDLEYLRDMENFHYSIYDGFLVDDGNGEFVPYVSILNPQISDTNYDGSVPVDYNASVKGTPVAGNDGGFERAIDAVTVNHGSGWKSHKTKSLTNFEYWHQDRTSIYCHWEDNELKTEGNCVLSSIFADLNYLATSGKYPGFPKSSSTVNHKAENDKFYYKYVNNPKYYVRPQRRIPILYYYIRQYAIDNFGYETGGVYDGNIPKIIKAMGNKYTKGLTVNQKFFGNFDTIKKEINAGYPVLIGVKFSPTYNVHEMVVTGYRIFKKEMTILGIKITFYIQILKVNDNWADVARYFDLSYYSKSLGLFYMTTTIR
ncbi:MAG: hypothetical protein IKX16_08055 [Clostridia bacterium]|nr:hypothetical protein [Clostridia bacterium]